MNRHELEAERQRQVREADAGRDPGGAGWSTLTPWQPTRGHDAGIPHWREAWSEGCPACERGIDPLSPPTSTAVPPDGRPGDITTPSRTREASSEDRAVGSLEPTLSGRCGGRWEEWRSCTLSVGHDGPHRAGLEAVWIVARKSDGEAMAVYAAEADANEDVARRHRRHRDRYKVEGWQVLGAPQKVKIENSETNEEAFGFEPRW